MKTVPIIVALWIAAASGLEEELTSQFQAFKLKHNKTYSNRAEEAKRFAIFGEKVRHIRDHNSLYDQGLVTYYKTINKFSDLTRDEFKAMLMRHSRPEPWNVTTFVRPEATVPDSIDWRTMGYVTPVKDQGDCGSCWSFSLTGTLEGQYFRKTGQLVSFSEQQLVDCERTINDGCDGGWMAETMPYIQRYGIEAEKSYPYTGRQGSCKYDASKVVTYIDSYVAFADEDQLYEAVGTVGPVSVAVNIDLLDDYGGGIFQDNKCNPDDRDHAVLAVGYDSENGLDYWIIKNSWGTDWGEAGYYRMVRGKNECGIAVEDTYPIIN